MSFCTKAKLLKALAKPLWNSWCISFYCIWQWAFKRKFSSLKVIFRPFLSPREAQTVFWYELWFTTHLCKTSWKLLTRGLYTLRSVSFDVCFAFWLSILLLLLLSKIYFKMEKYVKYRSREIFSSSFKKLDTVGRKVPGSNPG